jgi:hypothetical protein
MAGAKAAARAFEQSVSRCDERPVLGSLDYRSDDWVGSGPAGRLGVDSRHSRVNTKRRLVADSVPLWSGRWNEADAP